MRKKWWDLKAMILEQGSLFMHVNLLFIYVYWFMCHIIDIIVTPNVLS